MTDLPHRPAQPPLPPSAEPPAASDSAKLEASLRAAAELAAREQRGALTSFDHHTNDEDSTVDCAKIVDVAIDEKTFGIRVADTDEGRSSASLLINKMYAWRGYAGSHRVDDNPNRITLSASDHGNVCGTVTLGIDSDIGLLADEVFKDEIDAFRQRGSKVCEITKLAFNPASSSKVALASLFHILFIYGRYLHKCTDVFIEVNPRHRRFYETMLGFKGAGGMRTNPRVNAPAYLLWTSLDEVDAQIRRLGGTANHPGNERSLYPYFFSSHEEKGIANRLFSLD